MDNWITEELSSVDLGDKRLDQRYAILLERFEAKPSLSIPGACKGWTETQAAYRFFNNPKVSKEMILAPHAQATRERMKSHPVVLCVEDTSFINHDGQKNTPALGPHTSELEYGYFLHPLVAITPEKLCLGTLHLHSWIRDGKFGKRKEHSKKPIEEKESYRWIEGYRETSRLQQSLDKTQLVYMADRESDIYELFTEGLTGQTHWLIRAVRNRKTIGSNKIRDELANTSPLGKLSLNLTHRKKRKRREAILTIYSTTVFLLGPTRYKKGSLPNVQATVILAIEENPPQGEEAIEWLLLTDMNVSSFKEAQEKLEWYSCRWQIEIFFNTLKSGCQIEKLQLEARERLESAVALYMIVAWRLLYIRTLNRLFPEMNCETIFEKEEWQAIWLMSGDTELPKKPPALQKVIIKLAMSGGYLNRKHDLPPGVKVLLIGMQQLQNFITGFNVAKKMFGIA
ncbi:IS4 family transposase [bacterium]|nr:IS4 family transposase [bacterium]